MHQSLFVMVAAVYMFFAGSQQSQDQAVRRSGNTGEKHNENGVRSISKPVIYCVFSDL